MIKVIVFDFDGVLVDSNQLKKDVWFDLFSDARSQQIVQKVLTKIGRESRFDILRKIFQELGEPVEQIETLVNAYAEKYNQEVQKGILAKGLALEILESLSMLKEYYRLYLNSGTPESALQESIKNLGIGQFFQGIFGRPATKEENLEKIQQEEKVSNKEIVFVGDDEEDYQAAVKSACFFIGLINNSNHWQNKNFPLISNLKELQTTIELLST